MSKRYQFYYDMEGNPIDIKQWGKLFGDTKKRRVGQDEFSGYTVSTVWMGINHNFVGNPPLIFETMVFGPDSLDGTEVEEFTERYSTIAEAKTGHRKTVAAVKASLKDRSNYT